MSAEITEKTRSEVALRVLSELEQCAAHVPDARLKQMLLATGSRIIDHAIRQEMDQHTA